MEEILVERNGVEADELSPEDRRVLDALTDPEDVEAFLNIVANAREQGKQGVELVRENPEHTSRRAIRKLCIQDKAGFLQTLLRSLFGRRGGPPAGPTPMDFMKPPGG